MAGVTTYNFTVDDTSPQIVYLPPTLSSSSSDLQAGWNQYYNGTGFNAYPGQVGRNESWHVTNRDGAAFSIAFKGKSCVYNGHCSMLCVEEAQLLGNTIKTIDQLLARCATPSLLAGFLMVGHCHTRIQFIQIRLRSGHVVLSAQSTRAASLAEGSRRPSGHQEPGLCFTNAD